MVAPLSLQTQLFRWCLEEVVRLSGLLFLSFGEDGVGVLFEVHSKSNSKLNLLIYSVEIAI